jgi:hypothetical protein
MKNVLIGAMVAVVALGGCAAQSASAASSDPPMRTITGTGTGKVEGVPDTLTVTLGVQTQAGSAQAALARNADEATRVIAALKAAGIATADVQTSQLSLDPTYVRNRITGYSVSNVVTAKTNDVTHAGTVVDAAAAQAGDDIRVEGVSLSIEDTSKLVAAARADAVHQARAQAGQLARAADVRLGTLRRITEQQPAPMGRTTLFANGAAATSEPIEPGTQALTVDVTVVYAIG